MDRPSFRKNKISSYVPQLDTNSEIEFNLNEDKILQVLEPIAKSHVSKIITANNTEDHYPSNDSHDSAFDDFANEYVVDEEVLAYNQYFKNRNQDNRHQIKIVNKKDMIKYIIHDGIELYIDKSLNLKRQDVIDIISNALI